MKIIFKVHQLKLQTIISLTVTIKFCLNLIMKYERKDQAEIYTSDKHRFQMTGCKGAIQNHATYHLPGSFHQDNAIIHSQARITYKTKI